MRPRSAINISLAVVLFLLPVIALAYEASLSSASVRAAYFLGQRNDQSTLSFFQPYTHHLALPKGGPYISEIELLTPFAQVVDQSRQNTAGYSAQQAEQDYRERGDEVRLRVRIEFTPTYSGIASDVSQSPGSTVIPPLDFWKDFGFALKQDEQQIESRNIYGEPIYGGEGTFIGAYVWLEYAAVDVKSSDAMVEVRKPDGKSISTLFNLEKLR